MKRFISVLLATIMLCSFAIGETATASPQEMYAEAELLMVQGDYVNAAAKFEALSAYSDAAQMTLYCKAIYAANMGMYVASVDALSSLGQFKDAPQLAQYYTACSYLEYTKSGNTNNLVNIELYKEIFTENMLQKIKNPNYETTDEQLIYCFLAKDIFTELSLYKDSLMKVAECEARATEIIEAENAEKETKYQEALTFEQEGKFKEAIEIYQTLNGYKDSYDRIMACDDKIAENKKEASYAEMELRYQEAYALECKHDYESAAAIYAELSGYSDSTERLANCKNRAAYLNANLLEEQGLFEEAAKIYSQLINYRDSNDRLLTCLTLAKLNIGNGYDYLAENVAKLSLVEDASSYLLGDWDIRYFADDSRSVYNCDGAAYTEIGRFKEGMYKILADTALKTDTYAYTMQDASLQVSEKGAYQLRRISDVYYVAYSADSNGNYVIPVYLANRVIASPTGFTPLYSEEEYRPLKYANITQMNLSFATKPDDTLADWYSSEESVAKLLAALLVETDDYLDFQHYGQIGETYMAVYDNSMYVIMIGMNDHTIGYYYMPEQDVLMYYIIDGMVLGSQNVSDIYSSMGCAEFKQVPSDVWFEVFESYGATEDGIIANW